MKKLFLLMSLMATTVIASATDVWEGTHAVTWDTPLKIEATKFADAKVGQKIVVEFTNAQDVIELHSNKVMLPGTRYAQFIKDAGRIDTFITPSMLASLKEYGLEICGKEFTATKIWYEDGKETVDDNAIWTGYFWMDEWCTLELAATSFNGINWSNYKAIRFCSEANRTDYVINVLTKFDDPDCLLGNQNTMTMTNAYAELSLEGIDMAAKLEGKDRLMVQCNKEGGAAFNFTDIILVKKDGTAISAVKAQKAAAADEYFNLAGQRVAQPTKGLYIVNGKKIIK